MRRDRSDAANEYRRWYSWKAWKTKRKAQLLLQPLCEMCAKDRSSGLANSSPSAHRTTTVGNRALSVVTASARKLVALEHFIDALKAEGLTMKEVLTK